MSAYTGCLDYLHTPNTKVTSYQTDETGTIDYEFNSLGYRGEEFEDTADVKIFVCGCSMTLGIGVSLPDIWPTILAINIGDAVGASVSVLNMAQGGASNDHITRTLCDQIQRFSPDVVVSNFSYINRAEYNSRELHGEFIGPWCNQEYTEFFYAYYEDEIGYINSMKNFLLLREFASGRSIPLLCSWLDYRRLREPKYMDHPICKQLFNLVRLEEFAPFSQLDDDIWVDFAVDLMHPGPISNLRFADKLTPLAISKITSR